MSRTSRANVRPSPNISPSRCEFHSETLVTPPTSSPPVSPLARHHRINNPRLFAQGDLGVELGDLIPTLNHYANDHARAVADLAAYVDGCHEDRKVVDWDYFACLSSAVDELEDIIWRIQRWVRTRPLFTRWIHPDAARLMQPFGCPKLIPDPEEEGRFYVITPNYNHYQRHY
ncbi:uncharacterized protein LAJ45_03612 [Morchella importuna]|uniref:uncharacterized protein n=1 Tax=Morchella importuna TaxID=1174673 RepID=UPI001E8D5511|nr:uncharacterized protein LAJ45_03612 [Morchella importuna]KAH8152186.1 hypothetical protein LAJ45_03612 [Morchella importuna]